jgi:uncharacterized pyridoxamine 5'-phosphate oxidase family protein
MKIPDTVVQFLNNQGFVIVSTIDALGYAHSACKDIVKVKVEGKVFLLDVYHAETYKNLVCNPHVSITAVNEHKFSGYCLKGKARLISKEELTTDILKAWEDRIAGRLAQRLLRNIHEEKGHKAHPEALLPDPKYMIEVDIEEIVDLTPKNIK